MKTYVVKFTKSAAKEFGKLPRATQTRIGVALERLGREPRKGDVRPMVGNSSWRLRVGDYRIIYDIHEAELTVLIIKMGHRREVYRK